MQTLRRIHLYLGCFFAPMVVFFAISGIWQELPLRRYSRILSILSTIHTGGGVKSVVETGHGTEVHITTLNSTFLTVFAVMMAASLALNVVLGIVMAFKFGRGAVALASLMAGLVIPVLLIILFAHTSIAVPRH